MTESNTRMKTLKITRWPAMKIRKNKNREKIAKSIFDSESAAATVIAAVLLLCIIFTLFAVIRIAYVPEWKSDTEQLHMSEVQRDMTELKSTLDTICFFAALSPGYSIHTYPITIPFSMGGGEIPIMEPSKSSGTLSVNTEPCVITIILYNSSNLPFFSKTMDCGGVTFSSNNREYVDQIFRYENGALILKQGERSILNEEPSFFMTSYNTSNDHNISIQAISIEGYSDSISSNTEASLRLSGTTVEPIYDSRSDREDVKSFNCTITTKYPEAWKSYFNKVTRKAGLENYVDYTLESTSDKVYLNLTNSKYFENLYITKYVIGAEIGTANSFVK
jgi:hypothetical protein